VPQRGADSIAEHLELIEMLERGATFDEIEARARNHKLNFLAAAVRQLQQLARNRQASAPWI
jgi:hypothetical protein